MGICLDESDLKIVCSIIEAAIWYTISEKVEVQPPSEQELREENLS